MTDARIRNIVIVGGGTAGWMTAAGLSRLFGRDGVAIRLVESDAIGTVGVGEATVPHILYFNQLLGLDENEFIRRTNATFKLAVEFVDWGRIGDTYMNPFGPYGQNMEGLHFHHFWQRYRRTGKALPLEDYNLQAYAARRGRFQRPAYERKDSPLSLLAYAFHLDAGRYAAYLREIAEGNGVARTEGRIRRVVQNAQSGFVESVVLESGEVVEGDLFVDCSGFRGLLIEETLESGYEDWSHWLPCDRAVAQGSELRGPPPPHTRATAKAAGWQWRIPLQHRFGNGYVYCSDHLGDEAAYESLRADVDTPLIGEPNFLRFRAGVRRKPWDKNVVSIGLSSGFLEPLESTSIHMIQTAIGRLATNFPDKMFNEKDTEHYNKRTHREYRQIRDSLLLPSHATQSTDTPFWNDCRTMTIPDSLAERIALYEENARLYREDNEFFSEVSWLAVLEGQNVEPKRYHPMADLLPDDELDRRMTHLGQMVERVAADMPTHERYIKERCAASS